MYCFHELIQKVQSQNEILNKVKMDVEGLKKQIEM